MWRTRFTSMLASLVVTWVMLFCPWWRSDAAEEVGLSGRVRDSQGALVAGAAVALATAEQVVLGTTITDDGGRFALLRIPRGKHLLAVRARGFAERRIAVEVRAPAVEGIEVVLQPAPIIERITVMANPGMAENAETVSQPVNVIGDREIALRAHAVVAQVVEQEAGLQLQRTSPTLAGVFVRGLTGNKVNVFVDGVRYTTSAQRGGVSTFLNLVDPSSLAAVEVLRGPSSAQYGSDAIGGTVHLLTASPAFSSDTPNLYGRFSAIADSADAGWGSNLRLGYAGRHAGVLANLVARRSNTLRTGAALDSHSAVTRFLGLRSDVVIDGRLPETAFTQYGGTIKANWSPTARSQLIASYARGQQDGGKRYDQLLGGDGNLVADLRHLMLDFFYVRFDAYPVSVLDHLAVIYSYNAQREERVNQGGNGNPRAAITHEYERTRAHGGQVFIGRQWGARHNTLLGAEYYNEFVRAPAFGFDPVARVASLRRPRVPDGASYQSGGVYAQDVFDAVPRRLRLVGNLRYGAASYRSRATDSPLVYGRRLWPDDSLRADGFTFRAGLVVLPSESWTLSANVSRGFRAPHVTDLGTLGLTGSGFEVAAPDIAGRGGIVGSTADTEAVSTGRGVVQVKPESSLSYELGARIHQRRLDAHFAFFINDLHDIIAKQALILPPGAVGSDLGGATITAQQPNGVVLVAAASNPVLIRANFGDARIYGFEHALDLRMTADWSLGTVFTYLRARDGATGRPPNIEGGTPAPDGYFKIRYAPAHGRFWFEPYLHAAARQQRLSTLDLEDRRTGAARSRASIGSFFLNGATARGLVGAGPDGLFGTADDVLKLTGETLARIQDRILGAGVQAAPLFTAIPGYITFNLRGGFTFGENDELLFELENLSDRNYRGISWGLDAPGRGIYLRYTRRF